MTLGRLWRLCDISNRGDLTPGAESGVAGGTVFNGGEAMTAELEVVVDAGVGGQELLGGSSKGFACEAGGKLLEGWRADLNRCICRSRRRVGWCEASTRLFRYLLCRCSTWGRTLSFAAA